MQFWIKKPVHTNVGYNAHLYKVDFDFRRGYDNDMSKAANTRNVVFALYDGVQLLDIASAADVFATANGLKGATVYTVTFVAPNAPLRSSVGLMLTASPLAKAPRAIDTLMVPGGVSKPMVDRAIRNPDLMQWLSQAARRAKRVASICTGAFLLAELGLLDDRRATTHWDAAERLARTYPRTTVDPQALFVEDGNIWTSAGVAASIDLSLAIVTKDLGPDIAFDVARELVLHVVRPGGQSQFSAPLALQARSRNGLARLIPWLEERLDSKINVEDMASAMGMSERSFYRQCVNVFGLSPGKLVAELKLDRARMLLAGSGTPVSTVAFLAGFRDQPTFSKAFSRRFGSSPTSYRRAFAQS